MSVDYKQSDKEPWLAVILSTLFPGIGQIYGNQILRGIIFILIALTLVGLGGWMMINETSSPKIAIQFLLAYGILFIFNLFDAHRCTRKQNSYEFEQVRREEKDPWLEVFLSKLIPGLGHFHQGQIGFGFLFLLLVWGTALFSIRFAIVALVSIILYYLSLYHVYLATPTKRKSQGLIIKICLLLIIFQLFNLSLGKYLRTSIIETRYIPSEAMIPTLQINDRVIINKLVYQN